MMQILTLAEATEWVKENLYEADSFLFPLNAAVKKGLLVPIDGQRFAVREVVTDVCTWVVDSITKLSDEEMAEHGLWCRYRYHAHAENYAADYQGIKILHCGIS